MTRVAFVSCVKTKSATPVPAEHLYTSPWFRMAREYVRRNADRWFILSAEHGLLDPTTMTRPYDTTLNSMGAMDRRAWVNGVIAQMKAQDVRGRRLLILAGQVYRSGLMQFLWTRFTAQRVARSGAVVVEDQLFRAILADDQLGVRQRRQIQDLPGQTFAIVHKPEQASGDIVVVPARQRQNDCRIFFETGVDDVLGTNPTGLVGSRQS
jgi:Family of unknown function (DUF6884)